MCKGDGDSEPRTFVVVGGGVTGLFAAHALCRAARQGDKVILLEAGDSLGGHAHTVGIPTSSSVKKNGDEDKKLNVDVGFMVLNRPTYPNFVRVMKRLNVELEDSDMSLCVFKPEAWSWSFQTTVEWAKNNLLRPRLWRFLPAYRAFGVAGRKYLDDVDAGKADEHLTLGEFCHSSRLSTVLVERWIEPMVAAVWSAPQGRVSECSAQGILRFLDNHCLMGNARTHPWLTVTGRSRNYVNAIVEACREDATKAQARFEVQLRARVVSRQGRTLRLEDGSKVAFDVAVLACPAAHQIKISPEREWLSAFGEFPNEIVVHRRTDKVPLPPQEDLAAWNVRVAQGDGSSKAQPTRATLTYWLSRIQNLPDREVFLTVNPAPDWFPEGSPEALFRASWAHPRFDSATVQAQRELPAHQGTEGVFHAGAWLGAGFHEDGARSGLLAARGALAHVGRKMAAEAVEVEFQWAEGGARGRAVVGTTTHVRSKKYGSTGKKPQGHGFSYNTYVYEFDLTRTPDGFVRADHFGDPDEPIDTTVRRAIFDDIGFWPVGRILATCHLRCPWLPMMPAFNPITPYVAFDSQGRPEAALFEVHNTPWEERCLYAMRLTADGPSPSVTPKTMHVSPFNPPPGDGKGRGHRYRFGFERNESRTQITVTLLAAEEKDPANGHGEVLNGKGDKVDSDDDAIVTAVWSIPRNGAEHKVCSGSIRALIAVYYEAVRLLLKGQEFQSYAMAPPTPKYFLFLFVSMVSVLAVVFGLASASARLVAAVVASPFPVVPCLASFGVWSGARVLADRRGIPGTHFISMLHAAFLACFALVHISDAFPGSSFNPLQDPGKFTEAVDRRVAQVNSIFAGYLVYDLILSFSEIEMGMITHHVLYFCLSVLNGVKTQFSRQFIWLAAGEASTVLLGAARITAHGGAANTLLRLAFVPTFLAVRCVLYPIGLVDAAYQTWTHFDASLDARWNAALILGALTAGLVVNFYWASIILRRASDELSIALVQATLRRWAPRASLRWERKEPTAKDQGKKADRQVCGVESKDQEASDKQAGQKWSVALALAPGVRPGHFIRELIRGGDVYLGDSYVDRKWRATYSTQESDEETDGDALASLLRAFCGLMAPAEAVWQVASWLPSQYMMRSAMRAAVGDMNAEQASRSIEIHYDATHREGEEEEEEEGASIYRAFLDPTMTYTAAIWSGEAGETLEQAQRRKVDRILELTRTGKGDRLLDIGCGYGFVVGEGRKRGVLARGLCNSRQMQSNAARAHGPYFDLCDYRDIPPDASYDAITSVEMIEAVTARYFPVFARRCADALKPGGRLVLQVIIAAPWNNPAVRRREVALGSTFVTTHIFPGQQIPAVDWIHEAFRAANMQLEFSETNGRDYAKTLRAWRHNLDRNRDGLEARAVRTYRYYFAWCEAAFDEEMLHSTRFVFRKPLPDDEPLS
jgi:predicted NAD/FAD-binding protein/cyclopropane fatty-acyl-phospholipid synthase-like methyltransferase/DUF1365 family protein